MELQSKGPTKGMNRATPIRPRVPGIAANVSVAGVRWASLIFCLPMNVRHYEPRDNDILAQLFSETVRAVNSADYSAQQVEAWAGDPPNMDRWLSQAEGRVVLVAEDQSGIAGFATFEPNGHIDHLYVHHLFQRKGIGSALLRTIEGQGRLLGLRRFSTEASITARPFFERAGFRVTATQTVRVKGTLFRNYRMEKFLKS